MKKPSAIVVGVGAKQGLGSALCSKFATKGYHVYVVGRTSAKLEKVVAAIVEAGGSAESATADASSEADVIALLAKAFEPRDRFDVPDLVVFNAGANKKMKFAEISAETFEQFWRSGCLAGFLVGREAARHMTELGRGTILFTGASGSLRGKAGFAHFSAAKAGLRMISQSMAREFGPAGIHIAHAIIDGGIDGERFRTSDPVRFGELGPQGLLGLDAIADAYWQIHCQTASAWTQEFDLRPFAEVF